VWPRGHTARRRLQHRTRGNHDAACRPARRARARPHAGPKSRSAMPPAQGGHHRDPRRPSRRAPFGGTVVSGALRQTRQLRRQFSGEARTWLFCPRRALKRHAAHGKVKALQKLAVTNSCRLSHALKLPGPFYSLTRDSTHIPKVELSYAT